MSVGPTSFLKHREDNCYNQVPKECLSIVYCCLTYARVLFINSEVQTEANHQQIISCSYRPQFGLIHT